MFLELCLSRFPFTEWINEIILKLAIYRHSLKREHDLGKIIQACLCSPRNTPLAPLKGNLVPSGVCFLAQKGAGRPGVELRWVGAGMLGKSPARVRWMNLYAPLPPTYTSCSLPSFLGLGKYSLKNTWINRMSDDSYDSQKDSFVLEFTSVNVNCSKNPAEYITQMPRFLGSTNSSSFFIL